MSLTLSNRQKKIARKAIGTKPKGEVVQMRPKPAARHYEHDTGLAWLEHKKAISTAQKITGERYGRWYRGSLITDPNTLRSCLNDTPRGGRGQATPLAIVEDTAAWLIECREKVTLARSILNNHSGLLAALDLICGRQFRPTEIIPDNQREREEIVVSLRVALDMLEKVR